MKISVLIFYREHSKSGGSEYSAVSSPILFIFDIYHECHSHILCAIYELYRVNGKPFSGHRNLVKSQKMTLRFNMTIDLKWMPVCSDIYLHVYDLV